MTMLRAFVGSTRPGASDKAVLTSALTMLHSWELCRNAALARGDFATLVRCEEHIIWYELFLASLDKGGDSADTP